MTNEELLQQAKDQVAKAWIIYNMGYTYTGEKPWELIVMKYYDGDVPPSYTDEAALLAIQSAREEAAPKWIPVTERLPEVKRMVLVWAPGSGDARVAYLEYPKSHHGPLFEMGNHLSANVTHWMPLPDKPIEN